MSSSRVGRLTIVLALVFLPATVWAQGTGGICRRRQRRNRRRAARVSR